MSIRDLASQRAQYAFKCAQEAKGKTLTDYPNNVKKFPTMIRNAGFAKTFAFALSKKDKKEWPVYKKVTDDIGLWIVKEKKIIPDTDSDIVVKVEAQENEEDQNDKYEIDLEKLINSLIKMDTQTYRRAINETMSLFEWLRRFAEGMFPEKSEE